LTNALEMAAGLRPATGLLNKLLTWESASLWVPPGGQVIISFSGGVADCIETVHQPGAFGDMGPELGQAIRNSLLCKGNYVLGRETIRATVIGAGCHSAQLSGSTIFCRDVQLPMKNLPVAAFTRQEQDAQALPQLIRQRIREKDSPKVVLAMPGISSPDYAQVRALARKIAQGAGDREILVCLEADMAKALGQCLQLLLPERPCLCIDRVRLGSDSFLDLGQPVGPALPVVVKTLVLEKH